MIIYATPIERKEMNNYNRWRKRINLNLTKKIFLAERYKGAYHMYNISP